MLSVIADSCLPWNEVRRLTDTVVKMSDACCMHTQILRHGANMTKHDSGVFTYIPCDFD